MDKIKSSLGQAEFEVPKGETGYRERLADDTEGRTRRRAAEAVPSVGAIAGGG